MNEGILMFKVLGCFPADVQHCLLLMETILPMSLVNFPKKMENLSVFFIPKSCFLGEVSARLGTNSKICRITAIIRRDYLPNHYSRRSEYWVITRRIFANYWRPKLLASPRQQVPVLSTALRIAWCSFSPQTGRKEGRISGKNYIVATNIVTTFPMAEKLQQKRKNRVSKA